MAGSSTDRLLRRTRIRLFATTLALLTLLVVGVGAATAVMGLSALDADVDRALAAAVDAEVAVISAERPSGETGSDDRGEEGEDRRAVANTVILVLDARGRVLANRSGTTLPGLPDSDAVSAATATASDLRTVVTSNDTIRVLTRRITGGGADPIFVQGGFDMELHDRQSQSLVLAIVVVGALGLLADASHELRTPAALIRANAEVLEREGLVSGDGADLLADVIAEADRLGGMVPGSPCASRAPAADALLTPS